MVRPQRAIGSCKRPKKIEIIPPLYCYLSGPSTNQISCCMGKPRKSFFNVLRKSNKSFEKVAMPILRIIEQST